ncbi:MAG TPA: OmpA family protein [Terriglobia bacterium]
MGDSESKGPFWTSLPGVLTALAACVTALTGLLVALYQFGVLGSHPPANSGTHPPAAGASKVPGKGEETSPAGGQSETSSRRLAPYDAAHPVMSIRYAEGEPTVGSGPLYAEGSRDTFLEDFRRRGSDAVVVVIGYAYREGDLTAMDKLSGQRAEGVKKYLEKVGIPADQLHAAGHGDADPVSSEACTADSGSAACASSHRRVDLFWSSWIAGK